MHVHLTATAARTLATHPAATHARTVTLQALPDRVNALLLTPTATVAVQVPADVRRPGTATLPRAALVWADANADVELHTHGTTTTVTTGGMTLTIPDDPSAHTDLPALPAGRAAVHGLDAAAARMRDAGLQAPTLLQIADGTVSLTATNDYLIVDVHATTDSTADVTWPLPPTAIELLAAGDPTAQIGLADGQLVVVGDRHLTALAAHTEPPRDGIVTRVRQQVADTVAPLPATELAEAVGRLAPLSGDTGMVPVRGTLDGDGLHLQPADPALHTVATIGYATEPQLPAGPKLHFHVPFRFLQSACAALAPSDVARLEVPSTVAPIRLADPSHVAVLVSQMLLA